MKSSYDDMPIKDIINQHTQIAYKNYIIKQYMQKAYILCCYIIATITVATEGYKMP